MAIGGRLAASLWPALLLVACGVANLPPPAASDRADGVVLSDILVIVGYADHGAITEPLVEIIPQASPGSAEVALRLDSAEPMLIGVEGTVFFLRVVAPDGTTVADRVVSGIDASGPRATHLPGGDYTLEAYYRTCDGNCGLLDPKQPLCHVFTTVDPGARYELVVSYRRTGSSCDLVDPGHPTLPSDRAP